MGQIFNDFAKINDHLIVGSHPRDAADISKLYYDNNVRAIENLQQITETDKGDINGITDQCVQSGTPIWYQHIPVCFLHNGLQHFQITQMYYGDV